MNRQDMTPNAPLWFKKPKAEVARGDDGRVESVFIRLRAGKAAHTTRPNENCLVLFFWASDGLPIGIQLLEPIEGVALFELVTHLEPEGVDTQVEGRFFTSEQLDRVVHEMMRAAKTLPAAAATG